jgi:5-methylcytosine-specific restriction protein A
MRNVGEAKWVFHQRNGEQCWYCGERVYFDEESSPERGKIATIDHKIPISKGGVNIRGNKVTACAHCNQEKGDMTVTEYFDFLLKRHREKKFMKDFIREQSESGCGEAFNPPRFSPTNSGA